MSVAGATLESVLLASTFSDRCQGQAKVARDGLDQRVLHLETLARVTLPEPQAKELMDTCREYRRAVACLHGTMIKGARFVGADDASPSERSAIEGAMRGLLRDLEDLADELAGLTTEVARRIRATG